MKQNWIRMRGDINVLLVSGSARWSRAVRAAAAEIGCALTESRACARHALALLVGRQTYSHVLVEQAYAGDLMADLVGLTAGEAGSGVKMLLLGATLEP